MRAAIATALLMFVVACGGYKAAGLDASSRESVTVPIGARGPDALTHVQQAATRGGFTVANTSPVLVTVGPVAIPEDYKVRMMFAVSIVGDSANVRGTVTDEFRGLKDYPIRETTSGRAAWGWRELNRLANAVRAK